MMKDNGLLIFLILLWSIFIMWELDVQHSIESYRDHILRFDLVFLPILILFTIYVVYVLIRNQKSAKNKVQKNTEKIR